MNEMIASSIPVQTRKPLNYGIHVRLDENGRLLLSDPSRADLAVADNDPKVKTPASFILPIGRGAIVFEHRLTAHATRVFEATSILMEDELAHCPAPLWSSVLGLYQEVPEWLGLMWFFVQTTNRRV